MKHDTKTHNHKQEKFGNQGVQGIPEQILLNDAAFCIFSDNNHFQVFPLNKRAKNRLYSD